MFAPKVPKAQTKALGNSFSKMPQRSTLLGHRFGPVEQALFLRRTIGNQATLRLLAQQTPRPAVRDPRGDYQQGGATENTMTGETSRGASWDFSKIPLFPPDRASRGSSPQPSIIRRKLVVGQANDPLEHEADRVADHVMGMPAPEIHPSASPLQISRKCAACEAEEEQLQKKEAGTSEATLGEAPASVHEVLRLPGQLLDAATRAYFEPRFGQDFSKVRVHTGQAAERSARDVNAHAYTVGQNVIFDAARFAPGTYEGRRLLAHELTHVQQQLGRVEPAIQRQTPPGSQLTGVPGTPLELVARRIAELALRLPVGEILGPVLTVIRDTASGEIFVGLNTGVPPKLADVIYKAILQHHADIWSGNVEVVHTDPIARGGGHSEINALNGAVLAHEKSIGRKMTPAEYETFKSTQLEMENVWLKGAERRLTIAPSCEHCAGIGSGIRTVPTPAPTSPPAKTGGGAGATPDVPLLTPQVPPAAAREIAPVVKTSGLRTAGRFFAREVPNLALQAVIMLLFPPGVVIRNDKAEELNRTKLDPARRCRVRGS
jgi:hypothetical protein